MVLAANELESEFVGLGVAGWDGVLSVTTPDDAHTSLLSNMDSNSLSELADETQVVEVSPLFLHLVCSVHAQGDMGSYSIRNLPTCLSEYQDCCLIRYL